MRAILPAAGQGTRMRAVTNGAPKETLPLGNGRVIDLVIAEIRAAGAEPNFVWNEVKGPIPIEGVASAVQPEPHGLGHAILCGVEANEAAVLVALPDVVFPDGGPFDRLLSALDVGADFALAVERVAPERAGLYGIVELAGDEDWRIERLVEKPAPGETMSHWAVASRYALGPLALQTLRAWTEAEFGITEVLQAVLDGGGIGLAVPLLEGEIRYDCGSPEGYATAREALG